MGPLFAFCTGHKVSAVEPVLGTEPGLGVEQCRCRAVLAQSSVGTEQCRFRAVLDTDVLFRTRGAFCSISIVGSCAVCLRSYCTLVAQQSTNHANTCRDAQRAKSGQRRRLRQVHFAERLFFTSAFSALEAYRMQTLRAETGHRAGSGEVLDEIPSLAKSYSQVNQCLSCRRCRVET